MRKILPWLAILAALIAISGAVAYWASQREAGVVDRIAQLAPDQLPADTRERALLARRIADVKRDTGNTLKWNALADMLFAIEAFPQAEKAYRKSLDIDGTQPVIWSLMGEARVRQGTQQDPVSVTAVHAFSQALRYDPEDLRAHFYLSMADYNDGRRSKAISRMRYVLSASPQDSMAHVAARETLKEWAAGSENDAEDAAEQ